MNCLIVILASIYQGSGISMFIRVIILSVHEERGIVWLIGVHTVSVYKEREWRGLNDWCIDF